MSGSTSIPDASGKRRPTLTIARLMLGLAVLAVLMWGAIEFIVRPPAEARRVRLRRHREIRAQIWEIASESFGEAGSGHEEEFRGLAAWHRRRLFELAGLHVPSSSTWWAEGDRVTTSEETLFLKMGGSGLAPVAYGSFQ